MIKIVNRQKIEIIMMKIKTKIEHIMRNIQKLSDIIHSSLKRLQ